MTNAEWDRVFANMDAERARLGMPRVIAQAHAQQRAVEVPNPWTINLRAAGVMRPPIGHVGNDVPRPWSAAIARRREMEEAQ